jgi:hypothetical protein
MPLSDATSGGHRVVVDIRLEKVHANKIYVNDAILRRESNHKHHSQSQPEQPIVSSKSWKASCAGGHDRTLHAHLITLEVYKLLVGMVLLHRKSMMFFCGLLKCGGFVLFDSPLIIPNFCEKLKSNNPASS